MQPALYTCVHSIWAGATRDKASGISSSDGSEPDWAHKMNITTATKLTEVIMYYLDKQQHCPLWRALECASQVYGCMKIGDITPREILRRQQHH